MEIKNDSYSDYKTARQWALLGFLPLDGAEGIKLWPNGFRQDVYTYFSPDEVEKASKEQLDVFFAPERDKRRRQANKWRKQQRAERECEKEAQRKAYVDEISAPFKRKIEELHSIIMEMSNHNDMNCEGHECYVIDTKTTGFNPYQDEILQLSIINDKGEIVFNSFFKPCANSWNEAQQVNHISPEMVESAPSFAAKVAEINAILRNADRIIGYNTQFDVSFLQNNGIAFPKNIKYIDAMKEFARIYGEWDDYHQDYRYKKLVFAANYYGYDWKSHNEQAHNSLADCFATLFIYNKMNEHYTSG